MLPQTVTPIETTACKNSNALYLSPSVTPLSTRPISEVEFSKELAEMGDAFQTVVPSVTAVASSLWIASNPAV
jgi:hypothetical protein